MSIVKKIDFTDLLNRIQPYAKNVVETLRQHWHIITVSSSIKTRLDTYIPQTKTLVVKASEKITLYMHYYINSCIRQCNELLGFNGIENISIQEG